MDIRYWSSEKLLAMNKDKNALKFYILNNFLINHFLITFITIQQFYYYVISFQIPTTILRK